VLGFHNREIWNMVNSGPMFSDNSSLESTWRALVESLLTFSWSSEKSVSQPQLGRHSFLFSKKPSIKRALAGLSFLLRAKTRAEHSGCCGALWYNFVGQKVRKTKGFTFFGTTQITG
jgi:hypothetical protein